MLLCANCAGTKTRVTDADANDMQGDVPEEVSASCGNGSIDPGEDCDSENLGYATCEALDEGFTGGTLSCDDNCRFDMSECVDDTPEICGNGEVDEGEDCDGSELGGETCESLGFESGELACQNCFFDTSGCQGPPELCGNSAIDPGEDCDGSMLGYATCEALGFASGQLSCQNCFFDTSGCVPVRPEECGNGSIDPDEDCDGDNIGYATCEALGLGFDGGTLSCADNCRFDTSQCTTARPLNCGNGSIDPDEDCDGDNIGYATCELLGWTGGTLSCDDNCDFDESQCTGTPPELCGNGAIDPGEDCDGDELGSATCQSLGQGFTGGALSCADCEFDTSQCTSDVPDPCGNGQLDDDEDCDGDLLGGSTCESLGWGYTGGELACAGDCTFDDSACTPQCGNGACEEGETHADCPEDCEEVCETNPLFIFSAAGPTDLAQNINAHVAQLALKGGSSQATTSIITLRVEVQVATPDSDTETWRLKNENTLIISDYDADVSGDDSGLVVFILNNPITTAAAEERFLDVYVNTAEVDSGDTMQLFIQTECGEVEGPLMTVP
jgi:hypothetical protein